MSGVLICWINLPDAAREWYENEFMPLRAKSDHLVHCLQCEVTASGMENTPVGTLEAPWPYMTVYETRDIEVSKQRMYDTLNHPPAAMLAGPLKDTRFDLRTYREIKRWQDEEWDGDIQYISSVAAMEWRVSADKEEEVLKYYMDTVGPTISSSPDVLRFRVFEIDNATIMQGGQYSSKEKDELHTYFTLVELETEEWPWDVVVDLADQRGWKEYFEKQKVVTWQLSNYLMRRAYPGGNAAEAAK